jgi:cellulose synthase/poly-beta-1,6-N-acetylglucosamine synthase-like glycosyltransferase
MSEHAKAWTEAPGSLKQLWSQRYRWSYGTMQAPWKHRKSLTDWGPSGRFGRVGMPLVVIFQVITPVFAPLIDIFTVNAMIFVDFRAALPAWLAVLGVQLACAAYAFRLDREKYRYLLMMPLQQLAYRQMMGELRWEHTAEPQPFPSYGHPAPSPPDGTATSTPSGPWR